MRSICTAAVLLASVIHQAPGGAHVHATVACHAPIVTISVYENQRRIAWRRLRVSLDAGHLDSQVLGEHDWRTWII